MRRVVLALVPLLMALGPACSCQSGPVAQLSGRIAFPSGVLDFGKVCVGDTVKATVAVQNDGTVPLKITSAKATGSTDYAVVSFPKSLAPAGQTGAKGVITVSFGPPSAGEVFGDLVVTSDDSKRPTVKVKLDGTGDGGKRVDVHLQCENAAGTALADCPLDLDFGSVGTGATKDVPVVLVNQGCAAITVSKVTLTDLSGNSPAPGFTLAAPKVPFMFTGAHSQTVDPTFKPTDAVGYNGYLHVSWADVAGHGSVTDSRLGLIGTGVAFKASIVPASFVFAKATTTSPQTQTFTVSNQSSLSKVKITAISLRDGTPSFTIKPASALPMALPANGQATFDVTYAPKSQNQSADAVLVKTSAGTLPAVPISGGAGPELQVKPAGTVDFGKVATAATATKTVTVTNAGTADLKVTGLDLSQNPANTFSVQGAPTLPATVKPGKSFSFTVQFVDDPHIGKNPNGTGSSETGELDVQSDDPAYPAPNGYSLILKTDTMLNLGPTAALTTTVNGTACTTDPCSAATGDTVAFDASGSTDPENDPLKYAWTMTVPTGGTATLSSATGATTQLKPDVPGRWTVTVTVSDPYGGTDTRTADVDAQ